MVIIDWIRFGIAAMLVAMGLLVFIISTLGNFRFQYVINRMHIAALGDTLGVLFVLMGLIVICGFTFLSLKLLSVILFLWLSSPVSSHLISRVEVVSNDEEQKHYDVLRKGL